jgi:hypothetical protein
MKMFTNVFVVLEGMGRIALNSEVCRNIARLMLILLHMQILSLFDIQCVTVTS